MNSCRASKAGNARGGRARDITTTRRDKRAIITRLKTREERVASRTERTGKDVLRSSGNRFLSLNDDQIEWTRLVVRLGPGLKRELVEIFQE